MVIAQAAQNQPERAAPPVVDGARPHADHADGQQQRGDLDRPHPTEGVDELVQQPARQTGLDEVPVPEEHGVGDGAEERGAGERAQQGDRRVAAGRERGGDEADDPDGDGDEVEDGRELRAGIVGDRSDGRPATVDAGHRRDACRAAVVLGPLTGDAGLAPDDRHDEPDEAAGGHAERRDLAHRHGAERDPGEEGADGHQQVDAAQQPPVPEADLAAPRREPAERHPADRPLQQHGGGVERDHTSGGY